MARSTMEVAFLGTQMTQVEDTKYADNLFLSNKSHDSSDCSSSLAKSERCENPTDSITNHTEYTVVKFHFCAESE